MKMYQQIPLCAALVLLMSGCASIPDTYMPSTIGPVQKQAVQAQPVEVRIHSVRDAVPEGEPVEFVVTLRNQSAQPLWVPSEPEVLFVWTYSNGRRDNFMREQPMPRHYTAQNAVLLQPGEQMTRTAHINTKNFLRNGVTEFRAVLEVAGNTNPGLAPFWTGRATSNGYGVLVASPNKIASLDLSQRTAPKS